MIKFLLNKQIQDMKSRYDYDVQYMEDILQSNLAAFFKYWGFTSMSSHSAQVPVAPLFAARIRTLINEDCGPCIQLAVNMALEAGLDAALIEKIIKNQQDKVPKEVALTMRFTELVLAHDPDADDLKAQIVSLWGQPGLITLSFSISTYRVFPTLKYALGYGKTCHKIEINKVVHKPG
ncbi:hypothetical protein L1077_26585 [Pseudoalteromonas luteoviolacea]|uniref:hypothetical protein n=1 Tax=Pseudoalteromonas luteoviolacea TaxID=43657 RepID=UPI001F2D02FA|nr:hypothetical protein [Pseudoalteromonas luteoviolacea]MCF6442996.1 hypothetical protein [Pseudoalteromonas luteoviolacea]